MGGINDAHLIKRHRNVWRFILCWSGDWSDICHVVLLGTKQTTHFIQCTIKQDNVKVD